MYTIGPRHPVVRVYVSSTYTDMMLEKNVLVTEVYPRLKELCRERYGLEFQVMSSESKTARTDLLSKYIRTLYFFRG